MRAECYLKIWEVQKKLREGKKEEEEKAGRGKELQIVSQPTEPKGG